MPTAQPVPKNLRVYRPISPFCIRFGACRQHAKRLRSLQLPSSALAATRVHPLAVGCVLPSLTALTHLHLNHARSRDTRNYVPPATAAAVLAAVAPLPELAALELPPVQAMPDVQLVPAAGPPSEASPVRPRRFVFRTFF